MENDRQALHLQPVPVLGGPCDLIEVLSVRKFVTQLVRRLPKNSADAVPEAAERLEVEQAQVAILLPREPVVALDTRKRNGVAAFCIFREIRNVESARLCRGKPMQSVCGMLQEWTADCRQAEDVCTRPAGREA